MAFQFPAQFSPLKPRDFLARQNRLPISAIVISEVLAAGLRMGFRPSPVVIGCGHIKTLNRVEGKSLAGKPPLDSAVLCQVFPVCDS